MTPAALRHGLPHQQALPAPLAALAAGALRALLGEAADGRRLREHVPV